MWMFVIWIIAALAAAVFCLMRAVSDLRSGRYTWGIVGLVSATVFLLTPVQTHVVKVGLPVARS